MKLPPTSRISVYPVDAQFPARWSPRAMTGESIAADDLMTLFEAARWAPSSMNNQPWRFFFARRDTPHWPLFFDLLGAGNRPWCANAAALIVITSKTTFDGSGKPSRTHSYDTGAAWMSLALQGANKGLVVHGMQGFDYDRAHAELNLPADWSVEAMAAIGFPADPSVLPEPYLSREVPSDRKPLTETVFEGPLGAAD